MGGRSKYFKCHRCSRPLCIECLSISSAGHAELTSSPLSCHMIFCPNDCDSKAAEAIVTEKLVEDSVKKYLSAVDMRITKLDTLKADKTDLMNLEARLSNLENNIANPPSSNVASTPSNVTYQNIARKEYFEMDERKKRQNSVFVRGMKPEITADLFTDAINVIVMFLISKTVVLSNVQFIKPGLFRFDISNSAERQSLLNASKKLKDNPEYASIFL